MCYCGRVVWGEKNKNKDKKVFVGLSGGVDSAVAAALLKRQGYDVVGAFIRITLDGYPCTAGEDKLSAQRVAAHLRIPFVEVDLSAEYKQKVFDLSLAEFAAGRTPNPDALCNREIKFGLFYDWCMGQGADYVATGHYAQLHKIKNKEKQQVPGGERRELPGGAKGELAAELYAGADPDKDQSYFLTLVPEERLQKTLFPIGHLHKQAVRALAQKFGLPNAARPDSQGLCFLGPVDMRDVLAQELNPKPGEVLDELGNVIGRHDGAVLYTLGQRHGFVAASEVPLYVVGKDIAANTITVSANKFPQQAEKTEIILANTNWICAVHDGMYTARYRYRQQLIPAECVGNRVVLHKPHHVPQGQILALYQGMQCIGGGVIQKSRVY